MAPERPAHNDSSRSQKKIPGLKGQQRREDPGDECDIASLSARLTAQSVLEASDKGIAEKTFHPKADALQDVCLCHRVVLVSFTKHGQAAKGRFEHIELLLDLSDNLRPLVDVA